MLYILIFLFSFCAYANTGASALALPVAKSVFIFPIPLAVEAIFYKIWKIDNPFRTSLKLNLISTILGNITALVFSVVGFFYINDLLINKNALSNAAPQVIKALIFHYILTILFEYLGTKVLNLKVKIKQLLIVHLISYSILVVVILYPLGFFIKL